MHSALFSYINEANRAMYRASNFGKNVPEDKGGVQHCIPFCQKRIAHHTNYEYVVL